MVTYNFCHCLVYIQGLNIEASNFDRNLNVALIDGKVSF